MTGALFLVEELLGIPGVRADFIGRLDGVAVDAEREEVLGRLEPGHRARVAEKFGRVDWWRAEQVHGNGVAVVPGGRSGPGEIEGVDGLITAEPGEVLGIYVADCGPIWLADRVSGAVGLLHSGKKGTECEILTAGLVEMERAFGTRTADVTVVLGPCIRPPNYEVDFAAEIGRQARQAGVGDFHDCGIDTGSAANDFYSYRMERGRTGRMLALIMREKS